MARSDDQQTVTDDGTVPLDQSTVHRILQREQRRRAVDALATADGTLTIADLANAVVAADDVAHEDRQSALVELHHVHLPLLDDAGVVDYHAEDHLVHPRQDVLDEIHR